MDNPLKNPEQLLPYRSLKQILISKGAGVHTAGPYDTVLSALRTMADKHIGFLVVLAGEKLVGVFAERDYARKVVLAGRSSDTTLLHEVMSSEVVTVTPADHFLDCMRLMNQHRISQLPVVDDGRVLGVISMRDLLTEAIAHHEQVIVALEQERLTMLQSTT